jgi:hypothetical protein
MKARLVASLFETAAEPVIGRAFARPVGGLLRVRSKGVPRNEDRRRNRQGVRFVRTNT